MNKIIPWLVMGCAVLVLVVYVGMGAVSVSLKNDSMEVPIKIHLFFSETSTSTEKIMLLSRSLLRAVDLSTFRNIHGNLFADKNHVYVLDGLMKEHTLVPVLGADPNSLTCLKCSGSLDTEEFGVVEFTLYRDKAHVYVEHENIAGRYTLFPISGVDVPTLKPIEFGMYVDKNSVGTLGVTYDGYKMSGYYLQKIDNIDRATFSYIGAGIIKDKNGVYSNQGGIPNKFVRHTEVSIDPETFQEVDHPYYKDKHSVFFYRFNDSNWNAVFSVLPGADPKTFTVLDQNPDEVCRVEGSERSLGNDTLDTYVKDSVHYYCRDKVVPPPLPQPKR